MASIAEGGATGETGIGKKGSQKDSKEKEDGGEKGDSATQDWHDSQWGDAERSCTNQTAQERNWGYVKEHQRWGSSESNENWIQVGGQWAKNFNRTEKRGSKIQGGRCDGAQ